MLLDLRAMVSRRATLGGLVAGAFGAGAARAAATVEGHGVHDVAYSHRGDNRMVGVVDHGRNGFDPSAVLTDFDYGAVSIGPVGTVREWVVTAIDHEIEVAPGIMFPAWTYNGRVPGPSFRCVEGERLRFVFQNGGSHPHSMHFHGIHSWRMDGVPGRG